MVYSKYVLNLPDTLPLNKTAGSAYWEKMLRDIPSEITRSMTVLEDAEARKAVFLKHVCIIGIETSTYCNRSCAYCPDADPKYNRKRREFIPDAVWDKVLGNLAELNYKSTVSLNLYNEVLEDPSLLSKIAELRRRVPAAFIKFNSNGDFLDSELLNKLQEAGLDAIFISLHPAKGKPYIDEDRLAHTRKFFKRIGYGGDIDSIEPNHKIRTDLNYKGMRVLVMSDNWNLLGTSRGDLIRGLKLAKPRLEPCLRPFRECIVTSTGNVLPCCQIFPDEPTNQKHFLGNVMDRDLWDIYGSSAAVAWRDHLFGFGHKHSPCTTCSDPGFADPASETLRASLLSGIGSESRQA